MKQRLDHTDQQIIRLLQENARMSLKSIAATIFLSSPATSARIEKLEKEGYITGFHASINHEMMGYGVKAFVTLTLAPRLKAGWKEELLDHIRQCPNIIECNWITGSYAMLLEVLHTNTEKLEQFVEKLQRYGSTQTQIVYSTAVSRRELLTDSSVEKAG